MIACACVASALRSQSAAERLLHATAVDDVVHDDDECGQAVADAVLAQLHAITHIENVSHFSSAIFSSAIFPASAMTSPTFCCCCFFVLKKKKENLRLVPIQPNSSLGFRFSFLARIENVGHFVNPLFFNRIFDRLRTLPSRLN